jgi:phosphodiester glycosidase
VTRAATPSEAAPEYLLWRHELPDGETTTVYAVRHPRPATRTRVVHFRTVERLDAWCAAHGVDEAIIGGFFQRDPYRPLGELWIEGRPAHSVPIPAPYDVRRACVLALGTDVRLLAREEAPAEPEGDLLQAGPLLVRDGAVVFDPDADDEGFTAGSSQFDSDINDGRHPRAALGVADEFLIALACDGRRSRVDAGLSLPELAAVLVELGAESAINLDGGGSTTLVHRRHLLNRPYSTQDQAAPESRPIVSALVFESGA